MTPNVAEGERILEEIGVSIWIADSLGRSLGGIDNSSRPRSDIETNEKASVQLEIKSLKI